MKDEEARRELERMEEQAERTLAAPQSEVESGQDWTERWGRRVGLVLGYGLAAFLAWYFFANVVTKQ